MFSCIYCDYKSTRKFCVKRHEISKHSKEILNGQNVNPNLDNVHPNLDNVHPILDNVHPNLDNVNYDTNNSNLCKKCNKKFTNKYNLNLHETKCKGIDSLTCPKCMLSFSSRQSKNNHIKRNTCKAKSIIHSRVPNIQNIEIQNIETQNNDNRVITNNDNRICNTYIINNYGSERIDHFTHENMLKILQSANDTISLYIEQKHFNKDFPENHNILYNNKVCKIKKNNHWGVMKLSNVSDKLITDNSYFLSKYCNDNKDLLKNNIKNDELYNYILEKLNRLYYKHKDNKDNYNNLFKSICFMIENSEKIISQTL